MAVITHQIYQLPRRPQRGAMLDECESEEEGMEDLQS